MAKGRDSIPITRESHTLVRFGTIAHPPTHEPIMGTVTLELAQVPIRDARPALSVGNRSPRQTIHSVGKEIKSTEIRRSTVYIFFATFLEQCRSQGENRARFIG